MPTVGIGGWAPTAVAWFAETWDITQLRQAWPFLTKGALAYIASFETLAQFAMHTPYHGPRTSPSPRPHGDR